MAQSPRHPDHSNDQPREGGNDTHGAADDHRTDDQKKADAARADEQKKADALRAENDKKAAEGRKAAFEREQKGREDAFKNSEAEIAGRADARSGEVVTPMVATAPHFVLLNEPHHSAEFILSEANGERSRGAAYFADPTTVFVGMPVKQTAPATSTQPPTYVPAAVGADCMALCIYAGGSVPGEGLRIAVLVRDAEVNKNLVSWGAITAPEQIIGATTLAAAGIILR